MTLVEVDKGDARLIEAQRQYFAEISDRFGVRFDPHAGESEGIDRARQWHVIAAMEGQVAGCGSLRDLGGGIAEVKRVWVATVARGKGVASAIMDWLEACAAAEGFTLIRLDTNGTLTEAQAMYARRGYWEIARYNDNPHAEHWYEKAVGQAGR